MSLKKNQKVSKVVMSPKGELQWFKLHKPDEKFNKYSADLIVEDSEELRKFIAEAKNIVQETIKSEMQKLKESGKPMKKIPEALTFPIEEMLDSNGESTGKFKIKLRAKSQYISKKDDSIVKLAGPQLIDAAKKTYSADQVNNLRVNNGSIGKAQVVLEGYYVPSQGAGVTVKPKIVQLIELASYSGSGDLSGFDVEGESDTEEMEEFSSSAGSEDEDF